MAKVEDFPCTLKISIPFPTPHLASTALRALSVDTELSPLVRRSFSLSRNPSSESSSSEDSAESVLVVDYCATTNRMLRVAVNGFFESLGVVVGVMKDLDVDVIEKPMAAGEGLEGVQGLEEVKG